MAENQFFILFPNFSSVAKNHSTSEKSPRYAEPWNILGDEPKQTNMPLWNCKVREESLSYHEYINYFKYWANANSIVTRSIFSAIIKGELHSCNMIFPL